MKTLCCFSAVMGLLTACGARSTLRDGEGGSGGSGAANGSSQGPTTTASSGATTSGGGMCNTPPPPSPTQPTKPGCYTNTMNMGWVEVPCVCDLWLENTIPASVTAAIQLTVTPPDQVPTLDGSLEVEIAFEDPDATAFTVWSQQPGNGTELIVTTVAGTTTVRIGSPHLTLLPVPIPACTTRKATAHITGSNFMARLDMHAVLDDGMPFATTDNFCSNPPPT